MGAASPIVLNHADGVVRVEPQPGGRHWIETEPRPGLFVKRRTCETAYPLPLIREIHARKGLYLCDEIMREESPDYVEHRLRHEVLGYVDAAAFAGTRILDFGCGSGASTLVLARVLPPCELVGVELQESLLRLARLRATHRGQNGLTFLQSPAADALPADLGVFDHVIFSAVFEHLLPQERRTLLPLIWAHVKPGGILFYQPDAAPLVAGRGPHDRAAAHQLPARPVGAPRGQLVAP